MKNNDEKTKGILQEEPDFNDIHIVNYLECLGDSFQRFRKSHDANLRSRANFGETVLQKYLGSTPARTTIERCEQGSPASTWGIVASYIYEMGAFPDIIKAVSRGQAPTLRIMHLVRQNIVSDIAKSAQEATDKLNSPVNHKAK